MKILLLCLLFLLFGCNENKSEISNNNNQKTKGSKLMFFFNPNGTPCQIQNRFLNEIEEKISSKVSIKHVSTTNSIDRNLFYKYGVRSLPMIIIVDEKGNIIKRFPPGIKEKEEILSFVKSCKC